MTSNTFASDEMAKASLDAGVAKCNGGTLKVYDGTQPTDANTAITTQNLLGTFAFASTAFGASAASGTAPSRSAVATAATISDVLASGSGTATWARALKSDGSSVVFDCSAGLSGTDLILTDVTVTSGETMHIASLTVTLPE